MWNNCPHPYTTLLKTRNKWSTGQTWLQSIDDELQITNYSMVARIPWSFDVFYTRVALGQMSRSYQGQRSRSHQGHSQSHIKVRSRSSQGQRSYQGQCHFKVKVISRSKVKVMTAWCPRATQCHQIHDLVIRPVQSTGLLDFTEFLGFFVSFSFLYPFYNNAWPLCSSCTGHLQHLLANV